MRPLDRFRAIRRLRAQPDGLDAVGDAASPVADADKLAIHLAVIVLLAALLILSFLQHARAFE